MVVGTNVYPSCGGYWNTGDRVFDRTVGGQKHVKGKKPNEQTRRRQSTIFRYTQHAIGIKPKKKKKTQQCMYRRFCTEMKTIIAWSFKNKQPVRNQNGLLRPIATPPFRTRRKSKTRKWTEIPGKRTERHRAGRYAKCFP